MADPNIRERIKRTGWYQVLVRPLWIRARVVQARWAGLPYSPPGSFKQGVVRKYARKYGLKVLVETGTFRGDMLAGVGDEFDRLYSVELDERLFGRAVDRFAGDSRISLFPGDSEVVLPTILKEVVDPALFWLDAHEMVGGVQGRQVTPILEELQGVLAHPVEGHVILIDDARLFNGRAYPTLEEVAAQIDSAWPAARTWVQDDIIRSHP